ncbi:MAG: C-terminal binding protein [Rhizobiaceae bacterium]|nr:C-terminal binding protein [Rhizobiaceae bacterium]
MKIFCANWQAADDAALEKDRYPDIEFILQRTAAGSLVPVEAAALAEADAVINYSAVQHVGANPADFAKARIAVRAGVGFDNLDIVGWGAKGVPVCNVPDYGTTEVADHAIGLMLALTRGTSTYAPKLIEGGASAWHFGLAPLMRRHRGAHFGVIGLGRIGLAAARRASAFDMKVTFYDPLLESGVDLSTGYERVHSLEELMASSDIVSVHAPLSADTRGLLGDKAFAAAKPGLIVINTARGPIIDLDALERAMRSGNVAGAGIDVLPNEPQDMDHPLFAAWRKREAWIAERLIVTPHAAFYSPAAMEDLRLKSVEVVYRLLTEGHLTNCVNRQYLVEAS